LYEAATQDFHRCHSRKAQSKPAHFNAIPALVSGGVRRTPRLRFD